MMAGYEKINGRIIPYTQISHTKWSDSETLELIMTSGQSIFIDVDASEVETRYITWLDAQFPDKIKTSYNSPKRVIDFTRVADVTKPSEENLLIQLMNGKEILLREPEKSAFLAQYERWLARQMG